MFGSFKKLFGGEEQTEKIIVVPVNGRAVPMSEVGDPTFSQEILGKGAAIIPSEGGIVVSADGLVTMVFNTKYALSVQTESGTELVIYIGLDTVQLKGQYFEAHVEAGDKVEKGDLLPGFGMDKIKEAGYDAITPVVACNTPEFPKMECPSGMDVKAGETTIIKL